MRFLTDRILLAALVLPGLPAAAAAPAALTTVAEIRAASPHRTADAAPREFALVGTVLYPYAQQHARFSLYVIDDGTGCTIVRLKDKSCAPVPGDRIAVKGILPTHLDLDQDLVARTMELVAHGEPPPPSRIALGDLRPDRDNLKRVETEGTVEDVFDDDADPNWRILLLRDGPATLTVSLPHDRYGKLGGAELLGARVRVTGSYCRVSSRILSGWRIVVNEKAPLAVLTPARTDRMDAPPLVMPRLADPREIVALGRRSVTGRILASWQQSHALLEDDSGSLLRLDLADGESAPPAFTRVKAVGYAETDLYRINLSRVRLRLLAPAPARRVRPEDPVSLGDLRKVRRGGLGYNDRCFGRTLRAEGLVQSVPSREAGRDFLVLACDGLDLKVDVSACPEAAAPLTPGCRVAVSGLCILETGNWRPTRPFPPITGVIVAVRSAEGLRVLSRPSPWTARRLLFLLGTAVVALGGLFVWNRSLKKLAERRGRALADESLARAESEFKVYERTRLAVELHDSISQNLTGATMEMRVVREMIGPDSQASRHIALALKTIDSTRAELRNCIWDLRHDALGQADFAEAVRMTLAPLMGKTALALRFTVPRDRLSDNTAHAILRILRELTANAIRHGGAETVRVAGALEGDRLLFSVTDDGCGFDPENHPGMEDGHFGLEGVRERAAALGGELTLESRPGAHRTRIAVSIPLPREEPS